MCVPDLGPFGLETDVAKLLRAVVRDTTCNIVFCWRVQYERSDSAIFCFVPGISPRFAFPSDLLQYMAVFFSLAHVCCACRSVESTAQKPKALESRTVYSVHTRWILKSLYSPCLVITVIYLLFCPDVYPGYKGDFTCFPCRCHDGRLQSCGLAAQLQQQHLVIAGVRSIEPHAFRPLGHRLLRMSLANNSLVSLKARSFEHLLGLKILDLSRSQIKHLHENSFEGLTELEVLSLHGNELRGISAALLSHMPALEQLLLGSRSVFNNESETNEELESGNLIRALPSHLFGGNARMRYFDASGNNLTEISGEAFAGAGELRILDLSWNHVQQLPEGLSDQISWGLKTSAIDWNSMLGHKACFGSCKYQALKFVRLDVWSVDMNDICFMIHSLRHVMRWSDESHESLMLEYIEYICHHISFRHPKNTWNHFPDLVVQRRSFLENP